MTMTREEAIKELYAWLDGCCGDEEIEPARETFRMAIEALRGQDVPDTNVGDMVYRQAAIDIFDDYNVSVENGELEAYSRDRKRLCDLPSVQSEREHAKFIRWMECKKTDKYISYTPHCKCSNCGNELLIEAINYCYMCGAKMECERITDGTE